MYTLIIWMFLCTNADADCPTGDYVIIDTFDSKTRCNEKLAAWRDLDVDHRGVCYYKEEEIE